MSCRKAAKMQISFLSSIDKLCGAIDIERFDQLGTL